MLAICQVRSYRLRSGGIIIEILLQNIWKKEQLDDQKHHHQLDDNDHPQRTPDGHILKAIAIHLESVSKERFYSHNATKKATKKRLKHH